MMEKLLGRYNSSNVGRPQISFLGIVILACISLGKIAYLSVDMGGKRPRLFHGNETFVKVLWGLMLKLGVLKGGQTQDRLVQVCLPYFKDK